VIWNVALLDVDVTRLRRDLRIAQSKFRIRHKEEMKNISDALMEDDEEISGLLDRISEVEIKKTLLEAVAKSYDSISKAASREISRRTAEMESNLGNDA
jgi:lipoate-protein ligase A